MAKSTQQEQQGKMWECKECHTMISSYETMAYHLVDRILYGWCEPCYTNRNQPVAEAATA